MIVISADGDTAVVYRGITHGAVDFLIKPVRIEELKNIWQHVVRRKRTENNANGAVPAGNNVNINADEAPTYTQNEEDVKVTSHKRKELGSTEEGVTAGEVLVTFHYY